MSRRPRVTGRPRLRQNVLGPVTACPVLHPRSSCSTHGKRIGAEVLPTATAWHDACCWAKWPARAETFSTGGHDANEDTRLPGGRGRGVPDGLAGRAPGGGRGPAQAGGAQGEVPAAVHHPVPGGQQVHEGA